jgi:hypothetical protein
MALELAAYGATAGIMHRVFPRKKPFIYASLLTSMLVGRLLWGCAMFLCLGAAGDRFTAAAFLAGAFTQALPGIVLQFILVPPPVMLADKLFTKSKTTERR